MVTDVTLLSLPLDIAHMLYSLVDVHAHAAPPTALLYLEHVLSDLADGFPDWWQHDSQFHATSLDVIVRRFTHQLHPALFTSLYRGTVAGHSI